MRPLRPSLISVNYADRSSPPGGSSGSDCGYCDNELYDNGYSSYEWVVSERSLMDYNLSRGINYAALGFDMSVPDEVPDLVLEDQQTTLVNSDKELQKKTLPRVDQDRLCLEETMALGKRESELSILCSGTDDIISMMDKLVESNVVKNVISKIVDGNIKFPGTMFGNLTQQSLERIKVNDYLLSVKLDGVRVFLVIYNDTVYLYDRRMKGFLYSSLKNKVNNTILDCEVMIKDGDLFFVAFDIVAYKDKLCTDNLISRINMIRDLVKDLQLPIAAQEYYPCYRIDLVGAEGAVYSPIHQGYKLGFSGDYFKWKLKGDTADLLVVRSGSNKCLVCAVYENKRLDSYKIVKICPANMPFEEGTILECAYVNNSWSYLRKRDDKNVPNSNWVVANVIKSCNKAISFSNMYYHVRKFKCCRIKDKLYSLYFIEGGDVHVWYDESKKVALPLYVKDVSTVDWTQFTL